MRYFSCEPELAGQVIVDSGALPLLVAVVAGARTAPASRVLFCNFAVRALQNLVRSDGGPECLVRSEVVPMLVQLVQSVDEDLIEAATDILARLSHESEDVCNLLLDVGLMDAVSQMCKSNIGNAIPARIACFVCSCLIGLTKSSDRLHDRLLQGGILDLIVQLLGQSSSTVRELALKGLRQLSFSSLNIGKAIVKSGMIPPLVDMLTGSTIKLAKRACVCLRSICERYGEVKNAVLETNVLQALTS